MADPSLTQRTTLFEKESTGVTYRIPALIYIETTNAFLAFAEKRKTKKDEDAEYLVMKRGNYKEGIVEWGNCQVLEKAFIQGFRSMNPCPVYDECNKILFLFFNCIKDHVTESEQIRSGKNQTKLCYVESKDCGLTWSDLKDLTEDIEYAFPKVATFSIGPGHGIQMRSGALVLPAYAYTRPFKLFPVRVQSFYLYSETAGRTWHASKGIGKFNTLECEVAEILGKDGKSVLYCNARTMGKRRVEAFCDKIGRKFKLVQKSEHLSEAVLTGGCEGSTISFPGPETPGQVRRPWLLFSHPSRGVRKDLAIYLNMSPEDPQSWSIPWVIFQGRSAYSDLTHCKETDTFAILLECGEKDTYKRIDFYLFTLQDVLNNVKGE